MKKKKLSTYLNICMQWVHDKNLQRGAKENLRMCKLRVSACSKPRALFLFSNSRDFKTLERSWKGEYNGKKCGRLRASTTFTARVAFALCIAYVLGYFTHFNRANIVPLCLPSLFLLSPFSLPRKLICVSSALAMYADICRGYRISQPFFVTCSSSVCFRVRSRVYFLPDTSGQL